MPVLHSPESEYAKEMVKWEAYPTLLGPGLRPYVKRLYPWTLYRADRIDGHITIAEVVTVLSEVEHQNFKSRGFRDDPEAAMQGRQEDELEIARAAAERNFHEQRMSAAAQREAAAADEASASHVAMVPETPIRPKAK